MHEELPAPRTDARATRARAEARPEVHAVHARAVLRAAVPLLLVQPLPVRGGSRAALLRQHAQGNAHVEGPRLRLRKSVRGRRHAHHHDRRAVRHHRSGARDVQHRRGVQRDEPEPPDSQLPGQAAGSRAAFERWRAELRQRPAEADGSLRQVRQRRGDPRAHRRGQPLLHVAQRGHDLQLPGADRGRAVQRHRARGGKRHEPDHVLPADGQPQRGALAGAHRGQG